MAGSGRLENIKADSERYAYASSAAYAGIYAATGTYDGTAAPVYIDPEPAGYPIEIGTAEPGAVIIPRRRAVPRESIGSQVSFVSVVGVFVIIGLLIMLVYQYALLMNETSEVYSTGKGGTIVGLQAQLDNLKAEEERLIAQFENTFGYEYVEAKAVEKLDMVIGTQVGKTASAEDKAYIPSEAYMLAPDDILSEIINMFEFVAD